MAQISLVKYSNQVLQLLFGVNARRTARQLAQKDTVAIFYLGKYVAFTRPDTLASSDKDRIMMGLRTLGVAGLKERKSSGANITS